MNTQISESLEDRLERFNQVVANSGSQPLLDFVQAIEEQGVVERSRNPDDPKVGKAYHRSFSQGVFNGQLVYDDERIINFDEWMSLRFHELIHSSQHNNSPVLHAQPGNLASKIWLSPADFVLVQLLSELEAYSKQGWLTSEFLKAADQGVPSAEVTHPSIEFSVSTAFNGIASTENYDLRKTLAHLALFMRDQLMPILMKDDGSPLTQDIKQMVPLSFNYQAFAIQKYLGGIAEAVRQGGEQILDEVQFVRLTDADLIALTSTFGPSPMMKGDGSLVPLYGVDKLDENLQPALRNIEKNFKVGDRDSLPTLSEALEARGLTAQEFIDQSKNHGSAQSKPKLFKPK